MGDVGGAPRRTLPLNFSTFSGKPKLERFSQSRIVNVLSVWRVLPGCNLGVRGSQ
jgi:hypothetical protein